MALPPIKVDWLLKWPWVREWLPGTQNYKQYRELNDWVQFASQYKNMFVAQSPPGAHPYCKSTGRENGQWWELFAVCPEYGEDAVRRFGAICDHENNQAPIPIDERQTEWLASIDNVRMTPKERKQREDIIRGMWATRKQQKIDNTWEEAKEEIRKELEKPATTRFFMSDPRDSKPAEPEPVAAPVPSVEPEASPEPSAPPAEPVKGDADPLVGFHSSTNSDKTRRHVSSGPKTRKPKKEG